MPAQKISLISDLKKQPIPEISAQRRKSAAI
jgi:hypothetical protein